MPSTPFCYKNMGNPVFFVSCRFFQSCDQIKIKRVANGALISCLYPIVFSEMKKSPLLNMRHFWLDNEASTVFIIVVVLSIALPPNIVDFLTR